MRVLIAGGGIGGLTLALMLHKRGIRPQIFKRAAEVRPVGVGINTLPHAIRELGERKTLLLSTHILQEVDAVADRVLVISEGSIMFDGTPGEFRSRGFEDMDRAFQELTEVEER